MVQQPLRLTLLLLLAAPLAARAVESDRLAVEVLPGESAQEAALAYERACYRLGAQLASARPVQAFSHRGANFVRIAIDGSPFALRCLSELEPNRRGVDGTIEWFDGFHGGEVVPATDDGDRVPDAEWCDPNAEVKPPAPDAALVARLAAGDVEAIDELGKRGLPESLAAVDALAARGDAKALATLELVAKRHPHWRVRREALSALDPMVSTTTIVELAKSDPAWEVRHGAVEHLGLLAGSTGLPGVPTDLSPEQLLAELMRADHAWEVRRAALWQLSTAAVGRHKDEVASLARTDSEPRVRAAGLEVLTGAGLIERSMLRQGLQDGAPTVRTAAASALSSAPEEKDVPVLWNAMNAPERGVRIAAAGLLDHLDDATIPPLVFALYMREAEETDAQFGYLRALTEYLARKPFPQLADLVRMRLTMPLAPPERRLLACLHARLAPAEASKSLLPLMDSQDLAARAVAAECTPSSPEAIAKRTALLADEDANVRAAAVLGLCRMDHGASMEAATEADLLPLGLGQEALHVRQRCGQPDRVPPRLTTHLALGDDDAVPASESAPGRGLVPALAAMLLIFLSVIGVKVAAAEAPTPPEKPAGGDS